MLGAARMHGAGKLIRGQIVPRAGDANALVELREQHHASDGRLGGGDEEAVVAPGVHAGRRGAGVAAEAVGLEPF